MPLMNHQDLSESHVAAVRAARDALRDLYRNPNRDHAVIARLNADLGDALKLAEVHATLAVVDELRGIRKALS